MRFLYLSLLLSLVACTPSQSLVIAPQSKSVTAAEVVQFDVLLEHVQTKSDLSTLREEISDEQMLTWLSYQQDRCNKIFAGETLAERCLENELKVAELFFQLPIDELSEQDVLLSKEVYLYYSDLQHGSSSSASLSPNAVTEVTHDGAFDVIQLTEAASPLALYIVSLREVLMSENRTLY